MLVVLNHLGGLALALPLALLGALGLLELARLARLPSRAAAPGAVAVAAVVLVALDADGERVPIGAAVALAAMAAAVLLATDGARSRAAAVTAGGLLWLGGGLVHAVLLRDLTHGAGLVIAVLLATFIGDTAAQLGGSAFGHRRLAPRISPNKTVEGLAAGIAVGTAACVAAALFHDWLSVGEALVLGLACTLAAPAGDLFESALKRRAGVKDSGRTFGAHGGVLDRVDAALAAAVAGFYVALALGL